MNNTITVHYGYAQERVDTVEQLDALLDKITSQGQPIWAELVSADEQHVLNVGLGREFSSLTFYDLAAPAKYASVATLPPPTDDDIDFNYGGTPTPMQPDSAIPADAARAAAREFMRTDGQRPLQVGWRPRS